MGTCDCARSGRGWEIAGGYTSRDSHVRQKSGWGTPPARAGDGTLLGNHAQLCHAFWHVCETPELLGHRGSRCVRHVVEPGKTCETKGVVVVAALRLNSKHQGRGVEADTESLTFLSRYSVSVYSTPLTALNV